MPVENITDKKLWDDSIDSSRYGSIFHKWDFLKAMEKYAGYTLHTPGVYRGNELTCVFPLYTRTYKGMKLVFSPPPQTGVPNLGFVMSSLYDGLKQRRKEKYLTDIVNELNGEIKKLAPNYLSILTIPSFTDVRPFKWNDYEIDVGYEYVIDLTRSLDDIWGGFDATCKKNIKNTGRSGLVLKESDDVETFYKEMGERLSQKGQASMYQNQDPGYLREVLKSYPENVRMYFLYDGDGISGMQVICEYKDKFTLWLGSASGHYNEYLMWELIKIMKARGLKLFEIPDADTMRLSPFKAKFNPSLEIDYSIRKMDTLGKIAEWTFVNVIKGWV